MECRVLKSKSLSDEKALEKLSRFLERTAAAQSDAANLQAQAQQEGDDAAAMGAFAQQKINVIAPDIYHQLTLMRDAMRREQQQAKPNQEDSDDD